MSKDVTVEEINSAFESLDNGRLGSVYGVTRDPIVSSDIIGNAKSGVIDLNATKVIGGNFASVVSYYDNEVGYSNRLKDLVLIIGEHMKSKEK